MDTRRDGSAGLRIKYLTNLQKYGIILGVRFFDNVTYKVAI